MKAIIGIIGTAIIAASFVSTVIKPATRATGIEKKTIVATENGDEQRANPRALCAGTFDSVNPGKVAYPSMNIYPCPTTNEMPKIFKTPFRIAQPTRNKGNDVLRTSAQDSVTPPKEIMMWLVPVPQSPFKKNEETKRPSCMVVDDNEDASRLFLL